MGLDGFLLHSADGYLPPPEKTNGVVCWPQLYLGQNSQ